NSYVVVKAWFSIATVSAHSLSALKTSRIRVRFASPIERANWRSLASRTIALAIALESPTGVRKSYPARSTASRTPGMSVATTLKDRKSTRLNSSHANIYTLSLHDALPIYRFGHCARIANWRQKIVSRTVNCFTDPGNVRGHHAQTGGHAFQHAVRTALRYRTENAEIGHLQQP